MRKPSYYLIALWLVLSAVLLVNSASATEPTAKQPETAPKTATKLSVTAELISSPLGGVKPTAATQALLVTDESLADREIYAEYGINEISQRQFGPFQVRVYQAGYPASAYGLYSFYRDPVATTTDFGTEGDLDVVEGRVQFWQGNRYVEIINRDQASGGVDATGQMLKLAKALSEKIAALDAKDQTPEDIELAKQLPGVVRNLPAGSLNLRTARYILGPKALARHIKQDISAIDFYPEFGTEIAMASYEQGAGQTSLLIVEYHTPQQASAALEHLTKYRQGLAANEQAKLLIKREGNYIIEAFNFTETAQAERTVNEVKYEYVVKWLDDEAAAAVASAKRFTSEATKTGKLLVSVFSLIGITLITALIIGVSFGLAKFYTRKRNARYLHAFTDAGGMMRLNLDGIDDLKLPESTDESEQEHKLIERGK